MNAGVCPESCSFTLNATLSRQLTSSGPFKRQPGQYSIRGQKRHPLLLCPNQSATLAEPAINRSGKRSRPLIVVTVAMLSILFSTLLAAADDGDPMAKIKGYLVSKLERMDTAAHDFVTNANAYQAMIDKSAGD